MLQVVLIVVLFILICWLVTLTYFYWKLQNSYSILLKGADRQTLPVLLERLLQEGELQRRDIKDLMKRYATIEQDSRFHIQKIGLLRFNPFKDTGGDQSFILTLVDANDTGVIISGLYSRSGTRWYAKKIVKGKSQEHDLSDDEKKALKLAQPISHQ